MLERLWEKQQDIARFNRPSGVAKPWDVRAGEKHESIALLLPFIPTSTVYRVQLKQDNIPGLSLLGQ